MSEKISPQFSVLLPKGQSWSSDIFSQTILPVADTQVMSFINTLSQSILKKPEFRAYPELMAMGFWMRKAHILKILEDNRNHSKQQIQLARGVVFHIAPSNVDSIFIYSWFLSMLMGNINIIRLSSKSGDQINLLLALLNDLLQHSEYKEIASRQVIVSYGHDDTVTEYFSTNCDMRVIWGGDRTINKIRQIPIQPTATELAFTDKFSLSLIDAAAVLATSLDSKKKLITAFINDAYWFGQMACSSPRLIIWLGNNETIEKAKDYFWKGIHNTLTQDFADISAADMVNKLVASQSIAIESDVTLSPTENNLINRIQLTSLDHINTDLHCGAGLFYEFSMTDINEIVPLSSRKIQTVGYFGFSREKLEKLIITSLPSGLDRFVPIGNALDFSPIWDGYNLLHEFTRVIDIQ